MLSKIDCMKKTLIYKNYLDSSNNFKYGSLRLLYTALFDRKIILPVHKDFLTAII